MTEFISRKYGNEGYEVIIKTDNHEHYKASEDFARRLIDHAKPVTDTNVGCTWIPVSERLPDLELVEARAEDMDLFPCLVVKSAPQSPEKRFVTKAWYDGEGFMDNDCIRITKFVTNWMPLPEPPKEEYNE